MTNVKEAMDSKPTTKASPPDDAVVLSDRAVRISRDVAVAALNQVDLLLTELGGRAAMAPPAARQR